MSLAKTIIFGTDQDVAALLRQQPTLDEIDEYGYTPLIQTAIVNSKTKAKLLLDAGAKIDFPDLTGRTALFWAADNDNVELTKLCLRYGADPNAYSSGGQSALVMPFLKRQIDVKNILIDAGSKLDFAQDFINAKLLGHSFELEGRVDIVDTKNTFIEVELEGFYLRFTLEIIANSLYEFKHNFGAKQMRKYFSKLDVILRSLQNAIELIRLQHYLIDIKKYLNKINTLLEHEPLILPISFGGHAITLIRLWDWFIRCDRGEYGAEHGSVIYYAINHPENLTKSFLRDLIYKRQYPDYVNGGLIDHLGLQPKHTLGLELQKTGNCSWANAEAVIPALMFLLLLEEGGTQQTCEQESLEFYQYWREWNKTRSLDFCLQSFTQADAARCAAKAALLAAILYQTCDPNLANDRDKAAKIIRILKQDKYNVVLKDYAKVYKQDPTSPLWKNFCINLDESGVDVGKL